MKRIWDTIGAVIITAMVLYIFMMLLAPYIPWLVIALVVLLVLHRVMNYRRWW